MTPFYSTGHVPSTPFPLNEMRVISDIRGQTFGCAGAALGNCRLSLAGKRERFGS